jgi:type IV pilus assembly protein PilM
MAKNVIGIDISDFSIEAIALEKSKGSFKLESYARFRMSPEIVEDGVILNPQKLKDAILKMFANAKPIPFDSSRKVFLSIPESQTFSRVLSLPKNIKDKDLKKVVFNKAEEIIPEFVEKLTSVVKILPNTEHHRKIFYSSAETEVLKNFVNVFKELDIEVVGITTEAIASFAGIKRDKDKKNTLLLDLGARTTIASVFTDECLCSSINIRIGGNNITEALAKKLSISYNQAEDKKRSIGLSSSDLGETMLIAQGQLQPLVDELKVFIKYWQETNGRVIEQVILVGGLSQMKGADKYFGDNLNLPTEVGQSFIELEGLPEGFSVNKYINALGLARLSSQNTDINFYKKLISSSKTKNKNKGNSQAEEGGLNQEKSFKDKLKFINKNVFLITLATILFLVAIALVFFQDKLWDFYDSRNSNNISNIEELAEEVAEESPINLEQEITVSATYTTSTENFILGEYYELDHEQTFTPTRDPDYARALEVLEELASTETLALLTSDYKQEGYYIIPSVLDFELIETSFTEDNYIIGTPLDSVVKFKFLMFPETDLRDWLEAQQNGLSDKNYTLAYQIRNHSIDDSGDSFKILVFIDIGV